MKLNKKQKIAIDRINAVLSTMRLHGMSQVVNIMPSEISVMEKILRENIEAFYAESQRKTKP